jgi:hypothetical protein
MSKAGLAGVGSTAAFEEADKAVAELKRAKAMSEGVSYANGENVNATPKELAEECLRTAYSILNSASVPGPRAAEQAEIALFVASRVIDQAEKKGAIDADSVALLRSQMVVQRNNIVSLNESPLASGYVASQPQIVPEHNGNM